MKTKTADCIAIVNSRPGVMPGEPRRPGFRGTRPDERMMRVKDRRLTVYYAYSAKDEKVPCIRLQGKWLQKLGIEPGDAILVREDEGRLVIESDQKGVVVK